MNISIWNKVVGQTPDDITIPKVTANITLRNIQINFPLLKKKKFNSEQFIWQGYCH